MIDDVTRQFFAREARLLSPVLFDGVDNSLASTRATISHSREAHPHLFTLHFRADLRVDLESAELPNGWTVGGNSRRSGQIFLHHNSTSSALRVLSESRVNSNGVPHAGHNPERRSAWGTPALSGIDMPLLPDRSLLLLIDTYSDISSMRIVHTVGTGQYRGRTLCDFEIPLRREVRDMPERFEGDDENSNLFLVDIEDEGNIDV